MKDTDEIKELLSKSLRNVELFGVSLAEQGHKWTEFQRRSFQETVRTIEKMQDMIHDFR